MQSFENRALALAICTKGFLLVPPLEFFASGGFVVMIDPHISDDEPIYLQWRTLLESS